MAKKLKAEYSFIHKNFNNKVKSNNIKELFIKFVNDYFNNYNKTHICNDINSVNLIICLFNTYVRDLCIKINRNTSIDDYFEIFNYLNKEMYKDYINWLYDQLELDKERFDIQIYSIYNEYIEQYIKTYDNFYRFKKDLFKFPLIQICGYDCDYFCNNKIYRFNSKNNFSPIQEYTKEQYSNLFDINHDPFFINNDRVVLNIDNTYTDMCFVIFDKNNNNNKIAFMFQINNKGKLKIIKNCMGFYSISKLKYSENFYTDPDIKNSDDLKEYVNAENIIENNIKILRDKCNEYIPIFKDQILLFLYENLFKIFLNINDKNNSYINKIITKINPTFECYYYISMSKIKSISYLSFFDNLYIDFNIDLSNIINTNDVTKYEYFIRILYNIENQEFDFSINYDKLNNYFITNYKEKIAKSILWELRTHCGKYSLYWNIIKNNNRLMNLLWDKNDKLRQFFELIDTNHNIILTELNRLYKKYFDTNEFYDIIKEIKNNEKIKKQLKNKYKFGGNGLNQSMQSINEYDSVDDLIVEAMYYLASDKLKLVSKRIL